MMISVKEEHVARALGNDHCLGIDDYSWSEAEHDRRSIRELDSKHHSRNSNKREGRRARSACWCCRSAAEELHCRHRDLDEEALFPVRWLIHLLLKNWGVGFAVLPGIHLFEADDFEQAPACTGTAQSPGIIC